jgi:hypothetical protein
MINSPTMPTDFPSRILALGAKLDAKAGDCWSMVGPEPGPMARGDDWNPYDIGARRSWVPVLGEIVWEIPKTLEDRGYYAYTCQLGDGQQIGYVRVPDYNYNKDAVNIFEQVIARFESTTVAMVLDQVNNNGGSMFQMYALLSMLTDRALSLPEHQITIDDDYAAIAADVVADAEAGNAVPPDERPSPERVAYAKFVLSEKAAGRRLSDWVYLEGVSEILPAKNHYTKKIVVLINELTFSAGEFLAAILQDNKRATLFGQRTAGAGGCAKALPGSYSDLFRIDYITYTWTIARRTNGDYIENKGVHPDVAYKVTVDDLQYGHTDYRRALLATI